MLFTEHTQTAFLTRSAKCEFFSRLDSEQALQPLGPHSEIPALNQNPDEDRTLQSGLTVLRDAAQ